MSVTSTILEEATQLIRDGKENKGLSLILDTVKEDVLKHLIITHGWDQEEALTLLDDALLMIRDKLQNKENIVLKKAYIKKICENIGANKYRKAASKQKKFKKYWEEEAYKLQKSLFNYYDWDIDLFEEEKLSPTWQKALRAFSLLGSKCQKIIKLRYEEALSHEEIMKRIPGIKNIGTCRSTLYQCIRCWEKWYQKLKHKIS